MKTIKTKEDITEPTDKQIRNSAAFGWIYKGDGIFEHKDSKWLGYFSSKGFVKL